MSYPLEKLKFPSIDEKTELVDLIPAESFNFFEILHLDFSWLAGWSLISRSRWNPSNQQNSQSQKHCG